MRLLSQLPLLTAGLLMASHAAQAKVLSPRALVKNCDRVTQELTAFKTHQEGIVTALEQDTWDDSIFKKLEENSRMAEKFRAASNQLAKNAQDSQGPNLRAAGRAAVQGKVAVLTDMIGAQKKLSDCIETNNDLLNEVNELTERQMQAVSDIAARRSTENAAPQSPRAGKPSSPSFSIPEVQAVPRSSSKVTPTFLPKDPEEEHYVPHIEL